MLINKHQLPGMKHFLILIFCFSSYLSYAQDVPALKWWNPAQHEFHVIEGQAWPEDVGSPYDRLPPKADGKVSDAVWGLSSQAAGLMIRFRSNASEISIRYGVRSRDGSAPINYGMDHMPATGVSGVDLYAIDSDGKEIWCSGKRTFSDTIVYRYADLIPNDTYHDQGREYRLYLPLYNQVNWMEIGVEDVSYFQPLPVRKEKRIVIYGTSIAQGACASRPGMAWTAILGRALDRPLVNLGFSGSGTLEEAMIDLIAEVEAKIYVLDCLPNLVPSTWERLGIKDEQALKDRILTAVRMLKTKRPDIPVLLVDHAGYSEAMINEIRKEAYSSVNEIQQEAFYQLKKEGVDGLYYLTKEEIGLSYDATVDGTHPTDLGMIQYANSYEKKLRSILNEPTGQASTTQPVTQYREPGNYDWEERHREILEMNATDPPKAIFLANSIVHFWGGLPRAKLVREEESWEELFTPAGVRNYAYGWDRIENVLWRVYHGELSGFEAERVMLMIGINNLHLNTDAEIMEGLELLVKAIKARQQDAEITLAGLLPRREQEKRIANLNVQIARLAGDLSVNYADWGDVFLQSDHKINEALFSDGLHPNAEGYRKLRSVIQPYLTGE